MLNRRVPRLCHIELDQDYRFGFYEPAHLSNVHIFVYPELSVIGDKNYHENGLRKKMCYDHGVSVMNNEIL